VDLVAFYRGEAPDDQGRTLGDLWAWGNERLESVHDYIQALFPLPEPSRFNARAPLLDAAALARFRSEPVIRANLLRSLGVMLRFYGFREDAAGRVVPADNFAERAAEWLVPGDHNHLRITRILRCLTLCGLGDRAAAFLAVLKEVAGPGKVAPDTPAYWENAVASR
jgi:hypothetical protein